MGRCLATVGVLVAAAMLGPSVPASAGGYDVLRFRRDHYLVGRFATARSEFFAGKLEGSGPLDGRTYYAHLLPRTRDGFAMILPPEIPDGAIRVGALEVRGPLERDGYRYGVASLTFSVPDVPSGDYAVGFCDDPCRYGTVGWLAWGSIRIVHTPLEARLLAGQDRASIEIDRLARRLRLVDRREADLVERFAIELGASRVTAARVAARGVEPVVAGAVSAERGGPPWWLGVLVGFAGGVAAARALGRSRRRPSSAGRQRRPESQASPESHDQEGRPTDEDREPVGV